MGLLVISSNNPTNYIDPSGHFAIPISCPNWFCNTTWLDFSGWDQKTQSMAEVVGTAGCLVLGCHLDPVNNKVEGPTTKEYAEMIVANVGAVGADVVIAPIGSSSELVTVGRWMSKEEYDKMIKSGMVQESRSGTTHVAYPATPDSFIKQAKTGRYYVEFDVPSSSVVMTNSGNGWAKIIGPNSLEGRLAARKGLPVPEMPPATNILQKMIKE